MKTFWMSFCDPQRKPGKQFLGVIIMQGEDLRDVVIKSHILKINPGGEIKAYEIEPVGQDHMNRLLSKKQLKELGHI